MPWLGKCRWCRWCRFELTTYKYDSDLCTQNLKLPQAQRLGPFSFSWLGKYCIRDFRVASSAYSFNFSTNILCPSIITLSASYHTKASKRSNHLILFDSPPRSQEFVTLQQTSCFTSLLHPPALGLRDASLQVVSQAEGAFKNETQLQLE